MDYRREKIRSKKLHTIDFYFFIFIVQFVRVCNLSTVITSKITKNKTKTKQNRINCAWPSYGNPTMLNKSPSMPRAIVAHDVLFTPSTEPFQRTNPPLHQSKVAGMVSTDESKPWPRSECDEGLISLALFSNYRLGGWAKTDRVRSKVCFFHDTGNGIAQKLGKY